MCLTRVFSKVYHSANIARIVLVELYWLLKFFLKHKSDISGNFAQN